MSGGSKPPTGRAVFDSFALLAHFENEAGATRIREWLNAAATGSVVLYMSRVNVGEVLYITEREQGLAAAQSVLNLIEQLPIQICEATRDRVHDAAHIKAGNALSYADAFAVGLTRELGATLLTGDPELRKLTVDIAIEWIAR